MWGHPEIQVQTLLDMVALNQLVVVVDKLVAVAEAKAQAKAEADTMQNALALFGLKKAGLSPISGSFLPGRLDEHRCGFFSRGSAVLREGHKIPRA